MILRESYHLRNVVHQATRTEYMSNLIQVLKGKNECKYDKQLHKDSPKLQNNSAKTPRKVQDRLDVKRNRPTASRSSDEKYLEI